MRDFFRHQDIARRNSLKLVLFFTLAACLVVLLVSSAIYVLLSFDPQRLYHAATPFDLDPAAWDYRRWGWIALLVSAFIFLCTLYKYLQLKSGGGAYVAQLCGGRLLLPDTDDLLERRLLNIVEEMALASGVTVPAVFLLDREGGINAFAAGFSQEDAVIGVTRGALTYLERDELQGVVAHEFSHILYGDMLVNLRLQGVLHGILALGLLGELLLRGSARGAGVARVPLVRTGRRGSGAAFLVGAGVVLFVLGYIGALAGKLIKSAIVRQREYLADASAVQFTRNPDGLAGALKKIGGYSGGARVLDPRAAELSHLYFGNALAGRSWVWLSTHPPLAERIRRLQPAFKDEFPRKMQPVQVSADEAMLFAAPAGDGSGRGTRAALPAEAVIRIAPGADLAWDDERLRQLTSGPTPEYLRLAGEQLRALPAAVRAAARNPFSARAVVYGLLLDEDATFRARQLVALEAQADPAVWRELGRLQGPVAAISPGLRLPLSDLLLPALKTLSRDQYEKFRGNVQLLIGVDQQLALFEFALQHLLLKRLDRHFGLAGRPARGGTAPPPGQWAQISCVLSLLARQGHDEEREARRAFMRASRRFAKEMKYLEYLPAGLSALAHFAAALEGLESAPPPLRENLLTAALAAMMHDGVVTVREAELYRVITESLGIPAPPWLLLLREGD
ncbi:M48 family metalloprotease [Desulfurivibrio sp. D14AmB]|uniref:M48 family metalloprotease n=1 Tax=Desulfurivibrio sp. D14AmB TaxID=3374370 RepID=UPI00376F0BFE